MDEKQVKEIAIRLHRIVAKARGIKENWDDLQEDFSQDWDIYKTDPFSKADYIRMAEEIPFFIVEQNGNTIGFFTLRRQDTTTAELPLIYIDLDNLGKGIGSACIDYIEKWLSSNWDEVKALIVDTVIPRYNGGFYKKLAFMPIEDTFSEFGGHKIKALRLIKKLDD